MPSDCQGTATLGTNYCVKQPKYQDIGEDPDGVLGMCSGDCDTDDDCESGLKCAQNNLDLDLPAFTLEICELMRSTWTEAGFGSKCIPYNDFYLLRTWSYNTNSLNSCSGKVSVGINTTI